MSKCGDNDVNLTNFTFKKQELFEPPFEIVRAAGAPRRASDGTPKPPKIPQIPKTPKLPKAPTPLSQSDINQKRSNDILKKALAGINKRTPVPNSKYMQSPEKPAPQRSPQSRFARPKKQPWAGSIKIPISPTSPQTQTNRFQTPVLGAMLQNPSPMVGIGGQPIRPVMPEASPLTASMSSSTAANGNVTSVSLNAVSSIIGPSLNKNNRGRIRKRRDPEWNPDATSSEESGSDVEVEEQRDVQVIRDSDSTSDFISSIVNPKAVAPSLPVGQSILVNSSASSKAGLPPKVRILDIPNMSKDDPKRGDLAAR